MVSTYMLLAVATLGQGVRTDANGLRYYGRNEVVMTPGMRITAKTTAGTIRVTATSALARAYTWEGATRCLEMGPRGERWYGSMGLSFPGPGDHWAPHNGISRAVVEEAQARLHSIAEFTAFVKKHSYHPAVYRNDGLMVVWGKVPERRQLDVEVWQIVINGHKPKRLPGADDKAIQVEYLKLKRSTLVELIQKHNLVRLRSEIQKGADVNAADASGATPLLAAIRATDPAAVKVLLEAGAKPNVDSPDGAPLLEEAVGSNKVQIVKLLLEHGADPNVRIHTGMMVGETPLFSAAMESAPDVARILLDHGADPNAASVRGETALSIAASFPKPGSARIAEMLIAKGAKVDSRSDLGQTPLMSAAMFGNVPTVKVLLQHGANVNARSDIARHLAFTMGFSGGPQEEKALKKLQSLGLLDELHEDGPGVLDVAESPEIKQLLLAKGAKSFQAETQKRMQELIKLIGELAPSPGCPGPYACTLCHNACMGSHAHQYTIRGIPLEVDRVLRDRAKRRKISINQLIVEELTRATVGRRQHADFSDLVGQWAPDRRLDEILEEQRTVNPDDWR